MHYRKFFQRLSQSAAAVTAAVCAAVMSSVGYYRSALPDSYSCAYGTSLELDCHLPITAVELAESRAVYLEDGCGVKSSRVSLKLFGSVPIKDVTAQTIDRPRLIVSGEAFGIRLVTDGVMIVDMKKLGGSCPAGEAGLEVGDVIEEINGESVSSNEQVSRLIRESGGEECTVKYRRDERVRECSLTPVLYEGSYRAGMWVRDSSAGIGTMTFFDPETLTFAGLGHAICDSDTGEPLPLSQGSISDVTINGCTKGKKGEPGQLLGEFVGGDTGELSANCEGGVYGRLTGLPEGGEVYPLGFSHEVHEGAAYIITQTDGGEPRRYAISIEKLSSGTEGHDMIVKVTDSELIEKTGGIVQGMSGSPIIQDGRLVGAITHVFVDEPLEGYGIFAQRMYENM